MIKCRDSQFENPLRKPGELAHLYGPQIHLISDVFLLSHLAQLCAPETAQPVINQLVGTLYSSLLTSAVNQEFPTLAATIPSRMNKKHPREGAYEGHIINPETPVVCVNLARAGTYPSHLCYNALNYFMNPQKVRQDHIIIGRITDRQNQVTGSHITGSKIGGPVDGAIILFPDPMGATGSTLLAAADFYKQHGKARKLIALHCIVTPEYLKAVTGKHPDIQIYAIRLDRGLSSDAVLKTLPGTHWDEERGLNDEQYIVPGGGGFGEILNNAYV